MAAVGQEMAEVWPWDLTCSMNRSTRCTCREGAPPARQIQGLEGTAPDRTGYSVFTSKNQPKVMHNMGSQRQVEDGRTQDQALSESAGRLQAALGSFVAIQQASRHWMMFQAGHGLSEQRLATKCQ